MARSAGVQAMIGVVANAASGRNSHDAEAIRKAMAVFGAKARLVWWEPGQRIEDCVTKLRAEGCGTIIAAGGDGTVTALASALARSRLTMGVLPLGTFNFFARGLGLPQDPEGAARAILNGRMHRIALGTVNRQPFLNNASLGLYPAILKEREAIYGRFGRYRLLAHWSVIRTFLRFQSPMRLTLIAQGEERHFVTPLAFIARSAYQLERYGLKGTEAISGDAFAIFIAQGGHRPRDLFRLAWRLVTCRLESGRDVERIELPECEIRIAGRRRPLVAFDGERARMASPLTFVVLPDALQIIVPRASDADSAPEA